MDAIARSHGRNIDRCVRDPDRWFLSGCGIADTGAGTPIDVIDQCGARTEAAGREVETEFASCGREESTSEVDGENAVCASKSLCFILQLVGDWRGEVQEGFAVVLGAAHGNTWKRPWSCKMPVLARH
ncbi:hypothetical protein N9891_01315 [bacterium]|nr:hypothetical protein [bacterium]